MPTSARGSELRLSLPCSGAPGPRGTCRRIRWRSPSAPISRLWGFTLVELLVVLVLLGIASALVTLALPDSEAQALDREAERLALVLEAARTESRVAGVPVWWSAVSAETGPDAASFQFHGLPARLSLPTRWLGEPPGLDWGGQAPRLQLGPEPLIGAQRVVLVRGSHRVAVQTDGLAPFTAVPASE